MDSFVQLPVVKNSNDAINLRKLYDKIEISVRDLDSLDVKKENYRNKFINARLPEELRLYLSRNFKNNLWNIDDLLPFLKIDVEAKGRLISNSNYDKSFDGNKDNKGKNTNGRAFTSRSLFNSSDNNNPRDNTKKRCPFCNLNNNPPSRCLKVSNSVSRKTILRKSGLCSTCFSGTHLASQCTYFYCCNKCKGKHHISICTFDRTKNSKLDNSDDDSSSTNFSTNKNTLLLQTAYVEIKNPSYSQKTNAHLFFDSGSQRSYISKTLREELKLPSIRTEILKIKVFDNDRFKSEKVDIVSLS